MIFKNSNIFEKLKLKKYKGILIAISITLAILICFKYIERNIYKIHKFKELGFNIEAYSGVNLMPKVNKEAPPPKAYFSFRILDIDSKEYLNRYEIDKIYLNYKLIDKITYDNEYNRYIYYTSKYKDKNIIHILIKDKNNGNKYLKILRVRTEEAC